MSLLSMNEITTFRWSFEEDVAQYAKAGIETIGVWRQKLSDFGEERGIELLAESGLAVSNLLWAGGFTGSDGRTFQESVEDVEEAIRLAAAMHAGCLIVYTGSRNHHTHKHARRLVHDALHELAALAGELDVKLAVEPMHAAVAGEWTFLTTLSDTLDLLASVESNSVALAFDTYHLAQDRGVLEAIPEIVDKIAVVHLGDARCPPEGEQNRCPLGQGTLPLREVIAALTHAGYDGYYDVELIGEEIEGANYHDLLIHSKQVFRDLTGVGV